MPANHAIFALLLMQYVTRLRAEVAALEIHLPPELRHESKTFLGDTYAWYPCLAELRGVIDDIEAGAVALRGGAPEE